MHPSHIFNAKHTGGGFPDLFFEWDEGLEAYRERAGRNSEGVLLYEVDTNYGTQEGALRLITPNDRYTVDMYWSNRTPGRHLDALFANGDAAAVAGFKVEVRQIGDLKDVVRLDLRAS